MSAEEATPMKAAEAEEQAAVQAAADPAPVTPAAPAAPAAVEPATTAPPAAAAPAATGVTVESETKPAKKNKLAFLPKVELDVKCKIKRGHLPEPNITPKYYKDVDYENRDRNGLNPDLKVNFADVIAEPEGAHSFKTIWGTSFKTYSLTKFWCYRILTAVLAVPLSVFWGLYFALLAFCSIWCISPCIKGFIIWTTFISKIWGLMVRTFLDPLFESFGLIFTKIQVTLRMKNEAVDDSKQS
jgi:hypothetical protein